MALSPEKILARVGEKLLYSFNTYVAPDRLNEVRASLAALSIGEPKRYKFEYGITDHLTTEKGIYFFVLEGLDVLKLPFCALLYIGKAMKGNSFKHRFYAYRDKIDNDKELVAENVLMLTNLWPEHTYVYCYPMTDDEDIHHIEKVLINRLRPDFNEDYYVDRNVTSTDLAALTKKLKK